MTRTFVADNKEVIKYKSSWTILDNVLPKCHAQKYFFFYCFWCLQLMWNFGLASALSFVQIWQIRLQLVPGGCIPLLMAFWKCKFVTNVDAGICYCIDEIVKPKVSSVFGSLSLWGIASLLQWCTSWLLKHAFGHSCAKTPKLTQISNTIQYCNLARST